MRHRTPIACAALVVGASILSSCGYASSQAAAQVGSKKITVSQVRNALDDFQKSDQFKQVSSDSGPAMAERQFESSYLTNQIRSAVVRIEASSRNITTNSSEISSRIDQIKKTYPDPSTFQNALDQQGITHDQLNKLVADQILSEKLRAEITKNVTVTQSEIRQYFESNKAQFHQIHLAHITFSSSQFNTALSVSKKVNAAASPKKAQAIFSKAAAKYSSDTTTAAKGGDVGTVTFSQIPPNIQYALRKTKVANATHPVSTQNGFEVFFIVSSRNESISQAAGQIRSQIESSKQDAAFQKWLEARYKALDVSVNSRFGRIDPKSLQVVDLAATDFPNGATPPPTPTPTGTPLRPLGG